MEIQKAIKEIFDVVNAFLKAKSEDGPGGEKIVLTEKIAIGLQGLDLVKVATGVKLLIEDWNSRDAEKVEEWKAAFKENFDIPDDELESIIEAIVNKAVDLASDLEKLHTAQK